MKELKYLLSFLIIIKFAYQSSSYNDYLDDTRKGLLKKENDIKFECENGLFIK